MSSRKTERRPNEGVADRKTQKVLRERRSMMIVYVSPAEANGGILQFSTTITRETRAFQACKLFLPDIVEPKFFADISDDVIGYCKVKTVRKSNKRIYDIAAKIMSFSPDVVIFVEDSILMQQLNEILHKSKIKTAMIIHDIRHHPYRKMGMRRVLVDYIRRRMTKKTIKQCDRIILLSQNSERAFWAEYKSDNTVVFRLPAHTPKTASIVPVEIEKMTGDFFLFFGRIDEYKGVYQLCEAYTSLPGNMKEERSLVIAGKGDLSDQELALIKGESNIKLLRRFIEDGEMIWLFENCKAVILPYIEASQSGVLPIAYQFGKPVVISNLEGLTENVLVGKTGCIFTTVDELGEVLARFDSYHFSKQEISEYYGKTYSWKNNLEKLLESF